MRGVSFDEDITAFYDRGDEEDRLRTWGRLELIRTQELLTRFLPRAPAVVLDVGGGPGAYAAWLAGLGYEVHLLDPAASGPFGAHAVQHHAPDVALGELAAHADGAVLGGVRAEVELPAAAQHVLLGVAGQRVVVDGAPVEGGQIARLELFDFEDEIAAREAFRQLSDAPASEAILDTAASRAFMPGSAIAALISLLSLSTISAGVLAGAARPYHWLVS